MMNLLAAVLAYLLGSISFAVVVSKLMRLQDPRTYGSGNPGATNVLRTGNKLAAALTLIGDGFKGWLAVWLAQTIGLRYGVTEAGVAAVVLAVFLGHLYPLYTRFQGGKGVATAAGILIAIEPMLGLATLLTWLAVAVIFKYSSLAALVAAVVAPVYYLLGHGVVWQADARIGVAMVVMCLLLIYRHRANIAKLLAGKESKIGSKKR
jgi:glycerol-3-phosphate acyltransferase PlsY